MRSMSRWQRVKPTLNSLLLGKNSFFLLSPCRLIFQNSLAFCNNFVCSKLIKCLSLMQSPA